MVNLDVDALNALRLLKTMRQQAGPGFHFMRSGRVLGWPYNEMDASFVVRQRRTQGRNCQTTQQNPP